MLDKNNIYIARRGNYARLTLEDKNLRIIEEKMIEKFDFLFIPSTKLVMVQQHWLGLKFVSNEMWKKLIRGKSVCSRENYSNHCTCTFKRSLGAASLTGAVFIAFQKKLRSRATISSLTPPVFKGGRTIRCLQASLIRETRQGAEDHLNFRGQASFGASSDVF